jgi:Family of unknown function (DUF6232)
MVEAGVGAMTTFYHDNGVHIGSSELLVDDQAYHLDDLELVWHRRGPRGAEGMMIIMARTMLIVGVLAAIAGLGVAMRRVAFSALSGSVLIGGALLGVVLAGTVGLFVVEGVITLIERSYEKGSVEHQIWARHHDVDVLLFATRDKLRFGKIYRALQRAIEHRDV